MSSKKSKLNFDVRQKVQAQAELEVAQSKVLALEAEIAALKAPAVVAAPVATPPAAPSRLAELRAIKARGNAVEIAQFSVEHSISLAGEIDRERNPPTAA